MIIKENDNSTIQRRAVYNVSYLKHLLKDVTFVSYLNVFLNLPIFPRRITYIPAKECFNIEPVLMRKFLHTHYGKLYIWLCEERLPMFTKSHLYFHYRMCKELTSNNPTIMKSFALLESQYPDIPQLRDISGFYNFHHFMLEGPGKVLVCCWLAVEKLHALSVNDERAQFLEQFFDYYLYLDSPLVIPSNYRAVAYTQISTVCSGVRFVKRHQQGEQPFLQQFKDRLLRNRKLFRPLQDKITEDLRSYWLKRYYLHLAKQLGDSTEYEGIKRSFSTSLLNLLARSPSPVPAEAGDDDDMVPIPLNVQLCTTNGLRRTSMMVYDKDLGMDISTEEYACEKADSDAKPPTRTQQNIHSFEARLLDECVENRRRSVIAETLLEEGRAATESTVRRQSVAPTSVLQLRRGSCVSPRRGSCVSPRKETITPPRKGTTSPRRNTVASTTRRKTVVSPEQRRHTWSPPHSRESSNTSIPSSPTLTNKKASLLEDRRRSSSLPPIRTGSSAHTSFTSFDMQKDRFIQRMQNGRRASTLVQTAPILNIEWSRHAPSRTRGIIAEKYLEDELQLFRCCPCYLRDEIYKENYCDALKQVYDEASLKEVDMNNMLEISLASDAIGGEHFKTYLAEKADKLHLYNYQLWVEIENFSAKYSTDDTMMFCARGHAMNIIGFFSEQEHVSFDWKFTKNKMLEGPGSSNIDNLEKELFSLLYKYTHPDGERYTDWNDPFTDSLWFAIVNKYSVQEWLSLAQKFAAKKLLNEWLEYVEQMENNFLQNCTILRHNKPPPPFLHHTSEDLIFETMNSPNCHVMWAAMQLAEAVEYPGQNMPMIGSVEGSRNLSPEHRSVISSLSSSTKTNSPSKLFSHCELPTRRMLAGLSSPETTPAVTVGETFAEEEALPTQALQNHTPGRRGDMMSTLTDPTLSQLEYNLFNTAGLDLSTDKLSSIPKNFLDILRTRELLAKFRQFLLYNDDNQDPSILFYQIVETLKTCRNPKQRQERMQFIAQKFFGPVSPIKAKLMIDKNCHVYKELCATKKVTHTILLSAQTLVVKEMESIYWLQFLEAFPAHIREKILSMFNNRSQTERKEFGKEKNRRLWVNFTINVINFKNGIMDPYICSHFRKFLADYMSEISAKCTKTTQKRQVVNNKLIDIEKIQADLDFFIEVEKYKEICESVQASAMTGNYSPLEEEILVKKGRVLFSCYIDSILPPKVQINITHEKVSEIRKLHESGLFERGMFHDAALSLFPSLTYFWKKFCLQRYGPDKLPIIESDKLILKERNGKPGQLQGRARSTSPHHTHSKEPKEPSFNNVIHVNHVAQGIIHLLHRYTESAGLVHQLCHNNPIDRRGLACNRAGVRGVPSEISDHAPKDGSLQLGLLIKAGDRRLSVMQNYAERRSSIMSPNRIKRSPSGMRSHQ